MKYESYIRSLARYIQSKADTMQVFAQAKKEREQDLQKASFIEALKIIIYSFGDYVFFQDSARRISETAEYLNAPKSFVERQPRGKTAFQIGEAWKRRKEQTK